MNFETLTVALHEGVASVRLNRPAKGNAMDATMWQEIRRAFEWLDQTPEARVVVLQGGGCGVKLGLVYAAIPRLARYSRGLSEPKDTLMRFSLYQLM